MLDLAREAHRVREVRGADEEHVDALDRGQLGRGGHRVGGLDLHDAERARVLVGDRIGIEAEARPAVIAGDAARPGRRMQQRRRAGARAAGAVDHGEHHALGPEVERPARADALRRRDPHEPVDAGRPRAEQLPGQLLLAAGAMLQVDEHPVEPGVSARLGGNAAAEAEERAHQRLPGREPLAHGGTDHNGHDAGA